MRPPRPAAVDAASARRAASAQQPMQAARCWQQPAPSPAVRLHRGACSLPHVPRGSNFDGSGTAGEARCSWPLGPPCILSAFPLLSCSSLNFRTPSLLPAASLACIRAVALPARGLPLTNLPFARCLRPRPVAALTSRLSSAPCTQPLYGNASLLSPSFGASPACSYSPQPMARRDPLIASLILTPPPSASAQDV